MKNAIQFDRNGETGNIFYILGQANKVLRQQGRGNDSIEMFERVKQGDYENALKVIGEYVKLEDLTITTQGLYYDDIEAEKRTIDEESERSIKRYEQEQKQHFTYEKLIQYCKDTQTSQAGVLTLLRYYTDTLGWGMQASLDYVVGLFENGTIQKIKELGGIANGK